MFGKREIFILFAFHFFLIICDQESSSTPEGVPIEYKMATF